MNCPQCRTPNPPNTLYCVTCKTPLSAPVSQVGEPSPFEGFLPAWMQANASSATAVASPAVNSAPPAPATSLGFSLDELLQATETALPATPAISAPPPPGVPLTPTMPPPPFGGFGAVPPPPLFAAPAPGAGIPMPSFQEPPLWVQPNPRSAPNWNPPPTSFGSPFENQTPTGNAELPTGVERGVFYYTDDVGDLNVVELGSFWRRVGGAVIDAILIGILVNILSFFMGVFLGINMAINLQEEARRTGTRVSEVKIEQAGSSLSIGLWIMGVIVLFLYHFLLVGLGGQTIGHRLTKIKVLRAGGLAPGIISSALRALYGTVPGVVLVILSLINPDFGNAVGLLLYVLAALGLLWALIDPARQGLHDKLAKTYVVSAQAD
jgi:uncharacterized RDD family membrane protein YckC